MNADPTTVFVVKLEAQQWQIVMAGLGELPLKHSGALVQVIMAQFEAQVPQGNGVDAHPPMSFTEDKHDAVQ
jgi:hypothetical protein